MTRSIIITGGASGIGLAVARHFASSSASSGGPCKIAILDVLDAEAGARVAAECCKDNSGEAVTVSYKRCDVSSWEQQAAAFEEVFREHGGRVDVVMANAGISEGGRTSLLDGLEEEAGQEENGRRSRAPQKPNLKVLDVDLVGVIYSVKLALHYMTMKKKTTEDAADTLKHQSRGSIICTSSNAGLYPFPAAPLYAASKAGVIGLVRSVAPLAERWGIQVNGLAPAVLETNIAPDKSLFKEMVLTPMSTLTRGVELLLADPTVTGAIAEIHGESVTIRPHQEFVDEDTERNIGVFSSLGIA